MILEVGGARIKFNCGSHQHEIVLTSAEWSGVKRGDKLRLKGYFEKAPQWEYWNFSGGLEGTLKIEYFNEDGKLHTRRWNVDDDNNFLNGDEEILDETDDMSDFDIADEDVGFNVGDFGATCFTGKLDHATIEEIGGARIKVEWGYDSHEITLSAANWAGVKRGEPLDIAARGGSEEGPQWEYWDFSGGLKGELLVRYGEDGGTGFDGTLDDASIEDIL